jgi:hypothetical protein
MNKRLEKRHKRQVSRTRGRVKTSTPDLRTPEQLRAVRQASRALVGHGSRTPALYSTPPGGNPADSGAATVEKTEVAP